MVGMANNKGGNIVFGVKDSPHVPIGMTNDKFFKIDPKEIDSRIRDFFAPSLRWKTDVISLDNKHFGIISIDEAPEKPIVCKKGASGILREGAIYYRYRGETKEIEYPELKKLLDIEKEKERILWMKHIEKIRIVGPRNIEILDLYRGEISYGEQKILLDKDLLSKLNIIKEGSFTEREGEGIPVLKLIGEIEGLIDIDNALPNPEEMFPLRTSQIQERLGINRYQMQAIIFTLDLKSKPKFHLKITNGKNTIHKYAERTVSIIQGLFDRRGRDQCLTMWVEKYKEHLQETSSQRKSNTQ
jgi:uncharacterized ATP-binding protein UU034